MLGTIDRGHVLRILEALAAEDGNALLDEVEQLAERAADFATVLDELVVALQQLAVIELVGDRVPDEGLDALKPLAERNSAEDVQPYDQIAVPGRRDPPVGRDPRVALEMTLLRMLAFRPAEAGTGTPGSGGGSLGGGGSGGRAEAPRGPSGAGTASRPAAAAAGEADARPRGAAAVRARLEEQLKGSGGRTPSASSTADAVGRSPQQAPSAPRRPEGPATPRRAVDEPPSARATGRAAAQARARHEPAMAPASAWDDEPWPEPPPDLDVDDAPPFGPDFAYEGEVPSAAPQAEWNGSWSELIQAADVRGAARQLADHCELAQATERRLELIVAEDKAMLATQQVRARLEQTIGQYLGRQISISITPGKPPRPTPAEVRLATENERMRKAREA